MLHLLYKSARASLAASIAALALVACYQDDSIVPAELLPDISIAPLTDADGGLTVVSFEGNHVCLSPEVVSGYSSDQLSCDWYIIDQAAEAIYHPDTDTDYHFDRQHIASGQTLDYEVNLPPGTYTLVFEVRAANGYTVSTSATLNVVTNFSQGFYILKQTPSGQTELDLYNPDNGKFIQDVLTQVHGAPFGVAPVCLSNANNHAYIDTLTNELTYANFITITTADGQIRAMRTSDLRQVLDRSNILYTRMADDEQPYRIFSGMWGNYLISSHGVRFQYMASMSLTGSGKYGLESEVGGSPYVVYDDASSSVFFWDERGHNICVTDYNGTTSMAQDDRYKLTGLSRMTCVAAGRCAASGQLLFVLSSLDGSQRQLVVLTSQFGGAIEVQAMRALRTAKLNTARLFTTCCASAAFLYGVVDNTIYAMDLGTFAEQEIKPKGIGEDERIVYLSNQYGGYGSFDYLVVGTQTDGSSAYTLRFYNMLGGLPDGDPQVTLTSSGTPLAIHYTNTQAYVFGNLPLQD